MSGDIPPMPSNARDLLAFTSQTFDGHMRAVGAWEAEIGVRMAGILQRIAQLKHGIPPCKEYPQGIMGRGEVALLLKRRQAERSLELLNEKAEGGKHITVQYIEAELALDPQSILFEKKLCEMDAEVGQLQAQYDSLKLTLAGPLETTIKMLLAYSGQARVEKESYNLQRGRT
jgi:hypothetical protein